MSKTNRKRRESYRPQWWSFLVRASPVQSPSKLLDTLASDIVTVSSPEPSYQEDIAGVDIEILQDRQYIAVETVQELTINLARAQSLEHRQVN